MPFPSLSLLFPSLSVFLLCLPSPLPFLPFLSSFVFIYLFIDIFLICLHDFSLQVLSSFLTLLAFLSCPSFPYRISFRDGKDFSVCFLSPRLHCLLSLLRLLHPLAPVGYCEHWTVPPGVEGYCPLATVSPSILLGSPVYSRLASIWLTGRESSWNSIDKQIILGSFQMKATVLPKGFCLPHKTNVVPLSIPKKHLKSILSQEHCSSLYV